MENKVFEAINNVTAELAKIGISKDRKNAQQGYAFRGIDDIYNTLANLLAANKLCILPEALEREQVERATTKGGVLFYTTVKVKYTLVSSEDGSKFECTTYGEAMDSADKATNKAMSAAYKYLCLQVFCIPTEGDNDADGTTHYVAPEVKKMTDDQFARLRELGTDIDALLAHYNANSIYDLTYSQADEAIKMKEKKANA